MASAIGDLARDFAELCASSHSRKARTRRALCSWRTICLGLVAASLPLDRSFDLIQRRDAGELLRLPRERRHPWQCRRTGRRRCAQQKASVMRSSGSFCRAHSRRTGRCRDRWRATLCSNVRRRDRARRCRRRPAGRFRPRAGHRAPSPRSNQSWSDRARDRAPAPASRRRRVWPSREIGLEPLVQRHQFRRRIADPEGQRRAVEVDALGGQHFGLAIQRQVPAIFGHQHGSDHGFGRQSGFDQMLRRRRFYDLLARPAGEPGPVCDDHPVLGRDHVEPFAGFSSPMTCIGRARQHGQFVSSGAIVSCRRGKWAGSTPRLALPARVWRIWDHLLPGPPRSWRSPARCLPAPGGAFGRGQALPTARSWNRKAHRWLCAADDGDDHFAQSPASRSAITCKANTRSASMSSGRNQRAKSCPKWNTNAAFCDAQS